jgi:hypothetical protein
MPVILEKPVINLNVIGMKSAGTILISVDEGWHQFRPEERDMLTVIGSMVFLGTAVLWMVLPTRVRKDK